MGRHNYPLRHPHRGSHRLEQPRERDKPIFDWVPTAEWLADEAEADGT